ncbi:MAG TPA: PspC domain-containing protein [Sphingomonadaceae bacterium]|nr:PspC domain-containing protein [Sphingomonadaceae bacterium]
MSSLKHSDGRAPASKRSFQLDRTNGMVMGVCGGIGNFFGINANYVRGGFVLATLIGFGSPILLYLAIGIITALVNR